MKRIAVIILNYRRGPLTIGCIESLESELAGRADRIAVVVDNGSDDASGDEIEHAIRERRWSDWVMFVRNPINGGFAGGNNVGFRSVEAQAYLLLNSDARIRAGAIDRLLQTQNENPQAGMIGPELQHEDGTPHESCFRFRTPMSEFLAAAGTGVIDRMFERKKVAIPLGSSEPPQWVSFACVLIRREVIEQIGPMDEGYFMYFEDIDYARRACAAGWSVLYEPRAHAVHLRGKTSSVKAAIAGRKRIPQYYFEARSRYFAKFYGGTIGLWFTNAMWLAGRSISLLRELVRQKRPHVCERECRDNWINALHPLQTVGAPHGGEL